MDELDVRIDGVLAKDSNRAIGVNGLTMTRPLRSWALVLRANDSRLHELCASDVIAYRRWDEDPEGPACAVEAFRLDRDVVRALVRPIVIPWPGISIDAAAKLCGVNRTTIHRWAKAGRFVLDRYCKRNGRDRHRADKRVWTRTAIDPSGEIWSFGWRNDPAALCDRLPAGWSQELVRSHRCLGKKSVCRFWRCEACGRWVYKVYMAMAVWTVGMAKGEVTLEGETQGWPSLGFGSRSFVCRRCAKLVYESAERTSRPAPGRVVDAWDRFVRRLTDGRVRGREVDGC